MQHETRDGDTLSVGETVKLKTNSWMMAVWESNGIVKHKEIKKVKAHDSPCTTQIPVIGQFCGFADKMSLYITTVKTVCIHWLSNAWADNVFATAARIM